MFWASVFWEERTMNSDHSCPMRFAHVLGCFVYWAAFFAFHWKFTVKIRLRMVFIVHLIRAYQHQMKWLFTFKKTFLPQLQTHSFEIAREDYKHSRKYIKIFSWHFLLCINAKEGNFNMNGTTFLLQIIFSILIM